MRKTISMLSALLLSFVLFYGCANTTSDDTTTDNTNKTNEATDTSATPNPSTPTLLLPSVTKTLFGGELPERVGEDPLNGKSVSPFDEDCEFNNGEMSYLHYNTTSSIFKYSWNTEKQEIYFTPYKLSHKEHSGNDTLYDNVEDYIATYPSGTPWSLYKNELKEYYKLVTKGVSTYSYKINGEEITLSPIFDGVLLNCNVFAFGDFNNDDIEFSYDSEFDLNNTNNRKLELLIHAESISIRSYKKGQGKLIAKDGNKFTYLIRQNNSNIKDGTVTFQLELNTDWTATEAIVTATVVSADQTVLSNYNLAINDSFTLTLTYYN